MSTDHSSMEKRLDCLSRICLALGTALDGLGRMKQPPANEVAELAQQLLFATKQATWLVRTSDPWYVPRSHASDRKTDGDTMSPPDES